MFASLSAVDAALIGLLAGLLLALLVGVVWASRALARRHADGMAAREPELAALDARIELLQQTIAGRDADLARERERAGRFEQHLQTLMREHAELRGRTARLTHAEQTLEQRERELAELRERFAQTLATARSLETRLADEIRAAEDKLGFVNHLRSEFSDTFKALAGEVLHDNTQRLVGDHATQIGALLTPVREQLKTFQEVVQQVYVQEARERSLLSREIDALKLLNQQLGTEALNLTQALRGDSRVQGAWGELVLERLLEASGLREGQEYTTQMVLRAEDGGRPRPDVIVHLPQQRDLIIDAKVSLTAYERSVGAASEGEREQALGEHLGSLRRHVDGLSQRDYAALLDGRALDFVLLFVPVESAVSAAVRRDIGLYEYALGRNIAIVSPSTLLATLRAVSHLWKLEQRNRNAQEIAARAGKLYDKFVGFVDDLAGARQALSKAQSELDQAFLKLHTGKGNLVRQAEQLRELGARNQRALPAGMAADPGEDAPA